MTGRFFMKNQIKWCVAFVFFNHFFYITSFPVKALVKVPVCDLVGKPCKSHISQINPVVYYNDLPLCGQRIEDCPRIHQLLFNELITILEERGDECLVKVSTVYYESEHSSERHDTFWTLKKNFITCNHLKSLNISSDCFPDPLDYKQSLPQSSQKKTVVLTMPFYEPKTKKSYSAGTRFVVAQVRQNCHKYSVYILDPACNKCVIAEIPHAVGKIENNASSYKTKVDEFLSLMRRWIHHQGFIPYVWGGSSLINYCINDSINFVECNKRGYYQRPECFTSPISGFDCAGLIARAAQICGLPYYFKNSITIKKNLDPVLNYASLKEGDILWIPGHVMVVASLKNNTLIEARGYNHGFGKVHEVALNKVFKGIQNFEQLMHYYTTKKPLRRLDSQGLEAHSVESFVVLSLGTIMKKNNPTIKK